MEPLKEQAGRMSSLVNIILLDAAARTKKRREPKKACGGPQSEGPESIPLGYRRWPMGWPFFLEERLAALTFKNLMGSARPGACKGLAGVWHMSGYHPAMQWYVTTRLGSNQAWQ